MEYTSLFDSVKNVIDEDLKPYIEADGGKIHLHHIADGIVYVKLAGACAGCPGAMMTLRGGVERILMMKLPDVKGVEMVY